MSPKTIHKLISVFLILVFAPWILIFFLPNIKVDYPKPSIKLGGEIICAWGGIDIIGFDLNNYQREDLRYFTNYDSTHFVQDITIGPENSFLFSDLDECYLRQVDLSNKEKIHHVGKACHPTYLKDVDKLFYYLHDRKRGWELWVSDGLPIRKTKQIPLDISNQIGPYQGYGAIISEVVRISAEEIVYTGKNSQLISYNFINGEIKFFKINDCIPEAWRTKQNKLVCKDLNRRKISYFQIDLKTLVKENLPALEESSGLIYLPHVDGFIFESHPIEFLEYIQVMPHWVLYLHRPDQPVLRIGYGSLRRGIWVSHGVL